VKKIIFLLTLLASMEAQTRRFPFRAVGGGSPTILDARDFYANPGFEPSMDGLSPGQGRVNLWGHCVVQLVTPGSAALSIGHDYSLPSPVNRTNRWLLLIGIEAGARYRMWMGPITQPSTVPGSACSAPVSTPMVLPVPDANIRNLPFQWHQGGTSNLQQDYTAFFASHDPSNGESRLWEMYCDPTNPANLCDPADATQAAATNWQWRMIKSFAGSDTYGPYIDRTNQAFCISACGTGSPVFRNTFNVSLFLVATDGDNVLFSLRESSKHELGSCRYKISDDYVGSPNNPFRCLYLDAWGEMTNGDPPLPSCTKGNGPGGTPWNWASMTHAIYQMNGDPGTDDYGDTPSGFCRGTNRPLYYRAPWTNARVGRWVNPKSVTGTQIVAHGAPTLTGVTTLAAADPGPNPWWGFCNTPPLEGWLSPNNTFNMRYYADSDSALISTPTGQAVASKTITMFEGCRYFRDGFHVSFAPLNPRYQLFTLYEDRGYSLGNLTPKLPQGVTMMLVDLTRPASLGPIPNHPTPLNYGCIVQIHQHGSCENCPGGTYHSQGHGALSMDGSVAFYKSNGVRVGVNSIGFTMYAIQIPANPECQR
jgi:hypothetical protein